MRGNLAFVLGNSALHDLGDLGRSRIKRDQSIRQIIRSTSSSSATDMHGFLQRAVHIILVTNLNQ